MKKIINELKDTLKVIPSWIIVIYCISIAIMNLRKIHGIEQRPVDDSCLRRHKKRIAGHLAPLAEDIVVRRRHGFRAKVLQDRGQLLQVGGEALFHGGRGHDAGNHQVPGTGIHAAAPAFAAEDLDAVAAAVFEIQLRGGILVPAQDDAGGCFP